MNTVFFDIDTQLDFVYPAGALYVPRAEFILPAVAQLNRFAAANSIPLISTTDAHTEDDPEFQQWPHHCVAGAWGQRKPEATLVDKRVVVPNRDCPFDIEGAPQIILEKQTVDAFQTRHIAQILDQLKCERAVVYGVVTEICVLRAVRGLLASGRRVVVVTDAVETLKAEDSDRAFQEMIAAGAMTAPVSEICVAG